VCSQQTGSQNINEIQSNISNNDSSNVFKGDEQIDGAYGTITKNQTQYQTQHLHDNNINQGYNSSNITDLFLPTSNQIHSTMQQQLSPPHHPIIQQQQQQQQQRQQDTMDFEDDNKVLKRPNPAQSPTQSTPSIDGKKNKIPKN
jgi:hypothetical protein